jgi:hypothetical protein
MAHIRSRTVPKELQFFLCTHFLARNVGMVA